MLQEKVQIPCTADYQRILVCPFCKGENLHITEASIHRGDDIITVTSNRVLVEEKKNEERGVIITLEYEGECGHHGLIIFHFYKGNTFFYYRPLAKISDEKGMLHYSEKGDIFRD
jgi:uncharacterized protein YbaR (Trm112 family)